MKNNSNTASPSRIVSVKDIPEEMLQQWANEICARPAMRSLRLKQRAFIARRMYVQANEIKSDIERLVRRAIVEEFLPRFDAEVVSIRQLSEQATPADREQLILYTHSIFLMCDMIETFALNYDEIVRRVSPGFRCATYEELLAVAAKAKSTLQIISKHSDYHYQDTFGLVADDLTRLVINKAKSLLRKSQSKEEQ